MAIGDKRSYKVTEISPRHFEQTAKLAGFPIDALHEVMGKIVSELPRASGALATQLDARAPAAMADAILAAATTRAQQIEAYLNG